MGVGHSDHGHHDLWDMVIVECHELSLTVIVLGQWCDMRHT